jgi:hypothetical protein
MRRVSGKFGRVASNPAEKDAAIWDKSVSHRIPVYPRFSRVESAALSSPTQIKCIRFDQHRIVDEQDSDQDI